MIDPLNYLPKDSDGKILCQRCTVKPAVCESGENSEMLCRRCVEEDYYSTDEDLIEEDESLVFCGREWDKQG